MDYVDILTLVVSIACSSLSVYLGAEFMKTGDKLGKALGIHLFWVPLATSSLLASAVIATANGGGVIRFGVFTVGLGVLGYLASIVYKIQK